MNLELTQMISPVLTNVNWRKSTQQPESRRW